MSRATDLDLLRPVRFQPLQFDFQDAIVETGLHLVRINPERQLDRTRKRAVSALATLPTGLLLLGRASRSLQGQHVFLQADRDIVPGHARQLTSYHHAVVAEPNVDRREIAGRCGEPGGEQAVHFALHSAKLDKGVEAQPREFRKRHGHYLPCTLARMWRQIPPSWASREGSSA